MAAEPAKCQFRRIAGFHYPENADPVRFITPKESELKKCEGKEADSYSAENWNNITNHRSANRKTLVPNFDSCFLEEVVDISRTTGREMAIVYDYEARAISYRLGETNMTDIEDPSRFLVLFHTHPRAARESGPVITHSLNDLWSAYIYAGGHGSAASVVAGKICGEGMEFSIVAADRDHIYVTNPYEKESVEFLVAQIGMNTRIRLGNNRFVDPEVVVSPDQVAQIARNFQFPPELMDAARQSFKHLIAKARSSSK